MSATPTQWTPPKSGTVTTSNTGVVHYLQDGVTPRIEQDGVTQRVLQPNVVSGPTPTEWDKL